MKFFVVNMLHIILKQSNCDSLNTCEMSIRRNCIVESNMYLV